MGLVYGSEADYAPDFAKILDAIALRENPQ